MGHRGPGHWGESSKHQTCSPPAGPRSGSGGAGGSLALQRVPAQSRGGGGVPSPPAGPRSGSGGRGVPSPPAGPCSVPGGGGGGVPSPPAGPRSGSGGRGGSLALQRVPAQAHSKGERAGPPVSRGRTRRAGPGLQRPGWLRTSRAGAGAGGGGCCKAAFAGGRGALLGGAKQRSVPPPPGWAGRGPAARSARPFPSPLPGRAAGLKAALRGGTWPGPPPRASLCTPTGSVYTRPSQRDSGAPGWAGSPRAGPRVGAVPVRRSQGSCCHFQELCGRRWGARQPCPHHTLKGSVGAERSCQNPLEGRSRQKADTSRHSLGPNFTLPPYPPAGPRGGGAARV
ncbi:uncharacterized protein LOC142818544 [Pelodiscus sinensis]|uniref:uncharacterized protein LOC142818544 n=1 Tax=Pelodiscus sinensis TaxID=13735 RepID=UPI003F6CF349